MRPYADRNDAGKKLSERLLRYAGEKDAIVVGLPRGGVVVAWEIAKRLGLPLDVFVVRKLGAPGHEELAMGAIASQGTQVLNRDIIEKLNISEERIEEEILTELAELDRREMYYRSERKPVAFAGKHVMLIDDGLATGATLKAAVLAIRELGPRKITVAVPVGASDSCLEIEQEVDEMICPFRPEPFRAVGHWYGEFQPTEDDEVKNLLSAPTTFPH